MLCLTFRPAGAASTSSGEGLDTKAEVSVSSGSAVAASEVDTSAMMSGLVSHWVH